MKHELVYVAGAYRAPTEHAVRENIAKAHAVGLQLWQAGVPCIIPHKNTEGWGGAVDTENILQGDFEIVQRCTGLLLLDNWRASAGSNRERRVAMLAGIPIFTDVKRCIQWAHGWRWGDGPRLIGIAGPAGSGKSTLAEGLFQELTDRGKTVAVIGFADALKRMAEHLGLDRNALYGPSAERASPSRLGRLSVRDVLIRIGEGLRADVLPDVWVRAHAMRCQGLQGYDFCIVPDMRYPNEARHIGKYRNTIVRLRGHTETLAAASEHALDGFDWSRVGGMHLYVQTRDWPRIGEPGHGAPARGIATILLNV